MFYPLAHNTLENPVENVMAIRHLYFMFILCINTRKVTVSSSLHTDLHFISSVEHYSADREQRVLPGAEPHQGDRGAGEKDGDQQEWPPAPHIRQRTNQRSRHE